MGLVLVRTLSLLERPEHPGSYLIPLKATRRAKMSEEDFFGWLAREEAFFERMLLRRKLLRSTIEKIVLRRKFLRRKLLQATIFSIVKRRSFLRRSFLRRRFLQTFLRAGRH